MQPATPAMPMANPNCVLVVPPNPLSAQGLATPYRLVAADPGAGPCREGNNAQSAFVQGPIIDPATGKVSVYDPLVVDGGSQPAAAPAVPQLPAGAVVGLWFGFNGTTLRLRDDGGSLAAGNCVQGLPGSPFGQVSYCNAPAFFAAANTAIGAGKLTVPAVGTAMDGKPCPTTRDFSVVDQDQSDNVTTSYLTLPDGTTAQNTAANRAALATATVSVNGSDEGLLTRKLDVALGCTPWTAPDLADNGTPATALALNELQAAAHQQPPVALVPPNDPMTMVDGQFSLAKTNLYRAGFDMPALTAVGTAPHDYCANFLAALPRLQQDRNLTSAVSSPADTASNLFTFLAARWHDAYDMLGCPTLLNTANPVHVVTTNGVATDATFTNQTTPQPAPNAGANAATNTTNATTNRPGDAVNVAPAHRPVNRF